ncbi:DUF4431 domain-containing protein [Bradyrhizobium diazoefficiens]|nr:DUF4431 domain-containing protein [Bradyrhizobium diazoefficiens]MBR0776940.1 DUF4431 domain-containing protein [Bradyrhizobium diazoefficiens]
MAPPLERAAAAARGLFVRSLKSAAMLLAAAMSLHAGPARSACLDVGKDNPVSFVGTLTFRIFGGPPYNGGVTKGDTPEPAYILKLDRPICATGDEFVDPATSIDSVQVYPEWNQAGSDAVAERLRRLVGMRVRVEGKSPFGAHTGHHHAPLLLQINRVERDTDPTEAYDTPMTTVQGFYLALAAGSGEAASAFLAPEKRRSGPLSADAITKFYGRLDEPLSLIDVSAVSAHEFRVRYTFVARRPKRCDGEALVRTVRLRGENLISSIQALNGC